MKYLDEVELKGYLRGMEAAAKINEKYGLSKIEGIRMALNNAAELIREEATNKERELNEI